MFAKYNSNLYLRETSTHVDSQEEHDGKTLSLAFHGLL